MLSFAELPFELVTNIVTYVNSQGDLAALCRTNKLLRIVAEKQLFDSVYITEDSFGLFADAVGKHEHQIRHVVMDYQDESASPCEIAPWLEKFENLKSLHLHGGWWHWDSTDHLPDGYEPILWATHAGRLEELFERASLKHPIQSRVLSQLRSCILDFREIDGHRWFLDGFNAVFLIPQLHEVQIQGVKLFDNDAGDLLDFPSATELKILRLERTGINIPALIAFLGVPKALTHLTLDHDYRPYNRLPQTNTQLPFSRFRQALLRHKDSLIELKIPEGLDTRDGDEDDRLDLSEFSNLQNYNGPYGHNSGSN